MAAYDETLALADRYRQLGNLSEAGRLYEQLLQAEPQRAELWSDLGTVLQDQGKLDEAVACYRRALKLEPKLAALHFNLGNALKIQGNRDDAIASYCRAIEIDPNFAAACFNLGVTCQELELLDKAIRHYRRAIELQPELAVAHSNLGDVLQEEGKYDEAIACYRRALAIAPQDAKACNNLGNAFREQEQFPQALACYGQALERNPAYAEAHSNLGSVFQKLGKLDEALACYARALELNPNFAQGYTNLGTALEEQGQLNEAYACQCRALELNPNDVEAHVNRGMLLLLAGAFDSGWQEYEWRWKLRELRGQFSPQPQWQGEPLAGRTILLHAEQGLGDTLQFVRYLAIVKDLGATTLLSCPESLHRLLGSCRGIDRLVSAGQNPPPHDIQAALLSLPRILKTTMSSIPASVPYLSADAALIASWAEKLGERPPLRIGIHWHGRMGLGAFRKRDIPLEQFRPLTKLPGVQLVSLQKSSGISPELASLGVFDPGENLDSQGGAFMDTAAIMANLDLVISSDTSVPHLAGALGVPIWLTLPLVPDWRWLLDRGDSPWYPTMTLFRQPRAGDWTAVFHQINTALQEKLLARPRRENLNPEP
jgi:tetratricopeptide (TPR) repeat protein